MADQDLSALFPKMKPVKSPPALMRLNGCGTGMYGHRDHDAQTNTYVTALCFSSELMPASANEAMEAFWLMQIMGNPAAGQDLVRKLASLGIPMPVAQ